MIFISKYLVPKGYHGITIFPFIFLKYPYLKSDTFFLNHEKIHLRQQIEMLVLPFYIVYTTEFFIRLYQYKKWKLAYKNISFEREAYLKEYDLIYLKNRPFWNFIKYI